jgi:hypothetical protein
MVNLYPGFRKDRISLARVNLRVVCKCRVCVEFHTVARLLIHHVNAQLSSSGGRNFNATQGSQRKANYDAG